MLLSPKIIPFFDKGSNLVLDFTGDLYLIYQLQLSLLLVELIIYGPLDTVNASVYEGLEIVVIQVKGLDILGLVSLVIKRVVLFQVKDLLDIKEHLDEPIFAELPVTKLPIESELT